MYSNTFLCFLPLWWVAKQLVGMNDCNLILNLNFQCYILICINVVYHFYLYSLCFEIIGYYFIDLRMVTSQQVRATCLDHITNMGIWVECRYSFTML